MKKGKTKLIDGWLPEAMLADFRELAGMAAVEVESVLRVALAVEIRRWNRESEVRTQRDALLVFANEAALGAYKPKELRERARALIAMVKPNNQIQRAP